jgi:hypothetical protein
VSNLSSSPTPAAMSPLHRARKRRAKRGIVANYIHEISPRHRAVSVPVTAPLAVPAAMVAAPASVTAPAVATVAAEPLA